MTMRRRRLLLAACLTAAVAVSGLAPTAARAQGGGTIRIGMTAADIPLTHGQPDQGYILYHKPLHCLVMLCPGVVDYVPVSGTSCFCATVAISVASPVLRQLL